MPRIPEHDLEKELIEESRRKGEYLKDIKDIFSNTDFEQVDTIDNISYQFQDENIISQFSINKDSLSYTCFITDNKSDNFNYQVEGSIIDIMEGVDKFLSNFNDYLNYDYE